MKSIEQIAQAEAEKATFERFGRPCGLWKEGYITGRTKTLEGSAGWIPVREGFPLPDYDEEVLWESEGLYYIAMLDKDGNDWLKDMQFWRPIPKRDESTPTTSYREAGDWIQATERQPELGATVFAKVDGVKRVLTFGQHRGENIFWCMGDYFTPDMFHRIEWWDGSGAKDCRVLVKELVLALQRAIGVIETECDDEELIKELRQPITNTKDVLL